jgi:predicted DNA-binding protein YlxM (UPF0122 family)
MLEDTTRINMLYDFYGNLLTEKQREYVELYYQHDLSLAEIADHGGITRQGVHDLIKRGARTLEKAETRLGLVSRFAKQETALLHLRELLSKDNVPADVKQEALAIVEGLLD